MILLRKMTSSWLGDEYRAKAGRYLFIMSKEKQVASVTILFLFRKNPRQTMLLAATRLCKCNAMAVSV